MRKPFPRLAALACGLLTFAAVAADNAPVPACTANDTRTAVPVWAPTVNDAGDVDSEPPQTDGQIVYIRLGTLQPDVKCDNDTLNTFNVPNTNGDPGGLAVNVKGNAQYANGMCRYAGYFMNEDVPGMHQGWLETYFGAVDTKEIVLSGRYCLADSIE